MTVAKVEESPHQKTGEARHDELMADPDKSVVWTRKGIRECGTEHVADVGQAHDRQTMHDGPVVERPDPEGHVDPGRVVRREAWVHVLLRHDHVEGYEQEEVVLDPVGLPLERHLQHVIHRKGNGTKRAVVEMEKEAIEIEVEGGLGGWWRGEDVNPAHGDHMTGVQEDYDLPGHKLESNLDSKDDAQRDKKKNPHWFIVVLEASAATL